MKEESVFNVIMYLVKNCFVNGFRPSDHETLVKKLENAGFNENVVERTFHWVRQLLLTKPQDPILPQQNPHATRVYTPEEMTHLNLDCRRLLSYLEQSGILEPDTREMVIHHALTLYERIDPEFLQWITLLVLFTQPDKEHALTRLEFLMLDSPSKLIH